MAVYTILQHDELCRLLSHYDLAELFSFEGASAGIENSTYFLALVDGSSCVLTVFEQFSSAQLKPYIELTTLLHNGQLPVPRPIPDRQGKAMQMIADKPALLFERAPGQHLQVVDAPACLAVAEFLGKMHSVPMTPSLSSLANPCGLPWMKETYALVSHSLNAADQRLLLEQIALSEVLERRQLSWGIIHGDLFRDNVLFQNQNISAVIDFYNAGRDILLLDLAIVANDWCFMGSADQPALADPLLESYQQYRPLSPDELSVWHACLQVAAARFWLSRQKRVVLAQSGSSRLTKDPLEYKNLLLEHLCYRPIK
jgi:homoserine kinase type II